MFYTANDLPRSLEMCDAFDNAFARTTCSNGVFMENFSADQKLHVSEYLKESDPLYPCQSRRRGIKRIATCTLRPIFSALTERTTPAPWSCAMAPKNHSSGRAPAAWEPKR